MTKFRVKNSLDLLECTEEIQNQALKFDLSSEVDTRHQSALSASILHEAPIKTIGASKACTCKATVLVVDDNQFNMLPLTMLLKSNHGLTCLEASDGAQAVEIFRKDRSKSCCQIRIQIVLMDIIMPIMDGFQATIGIMEILRQERALKSTKYDTSNDLT